MRTFVPVSYRRVHTYQYRYSMKSAYLNLEFLLVVPPIVNRVKQRLPLTLAHICENASYKYNKVCPSTLAALPFISGRTV